MATTADLSRGMYLRHNGELCILIDYQHTMPGKGGAYYQAKMKNVKTGKSVEHRYRSGEEIFPVRVEERELQYLYKDGTSMVCMDTNSYEQIYIEESLFGDALQFLKEEMMVTVAFESENPIYATAPNFVELEITYSEPGVRGDTATNATKPATLETGATVNVPLFVDQGEKIKVDTRTGEYVERVK